MNLDATFESFEHMKLDAFDNVRHVDGPAVTLLEIMPVSIVAIACLSSYCDDGADSRSFPLNANGFPWIEKFLDHYVGPWVTKWDPNSMPLKAKAPRKFLKGPQKYGIDFSGEAKRPMAYVRTRLAAAGLVYGQCLAGELGLRWCLSPRDPNSPKLSLRFPDPTNTMELRPWAKVAKYAHLGKEDQLASMLPFARNAKLFDAAEKIVAMVVEKHGDHFDGRKVHRRQFWVDDDGELDAILLFDEKDKQIAAIKVEGSLAELVGGAS